MSNFNKLNIFKNFKINIIKLFLFAVAAFYYSGVAYETYENELSSLPLNLDESNKVASALLKQEADKMVNITDQLFIITTGSYTSIADLIEELHTSITDSVDKFINDNQRKSKSWKL